MTSYRTVHFQDLLQPTLPASTYSYPAEDEDIHLKWHFVHWFTLVRHPTLTDEEYEALQVKWVALELTEARDMNTYTYLTGARAC